MFILESRVKQCYFCKSSILKWHNRQKHQFFQIPYVFCITVKFYHLRIEVFQNCSAFVFIIFSCEKKSEGIEIKEYQKSKALLGDK